MNMEKETSKTSMAYDMGKYANSVEVGNNGHTCRIENRTYIRNMELRTTATRSLWQQKLSQAEEQRIASRIEAEREATGTVALKDEQIRPLTLTDSEKIEELLLFTNCRIITRDKRTVLSANDVEAPHRKYQLTAYKQLNDQISIGQKGKVLTVKKVYEPIKSVYPEGKDNRKYNCWGNDRYQWAK